MQIPQLDSLSTNRLSRVFNNTVATYKYYWLISILNIHMSTGATRISIWDIVISMVANAWYPIHYFRLSFGKSDSMYVAIKTIRELTDLPYDASKKLIEETLRDQLDKKEIKAALRVFTLNVPFRFLSPWINTSENKDVVRRSHSFENGALYALHKDDIEDWIIELNPAWCDYLKQHYSILLDFAYWNLTLFLQTRNPNVPNIPNKLIRPEARKSLNNQRQFWNAVIKASGPIECIYTGAELYAGNFDLDHFIPWSFVTHDLSWNLIPSNPTINSSKSDRIPDLDFYLPKLSCAHHSAIKTYCGLGKSEKALEDYISLGYTVRELLEMPQDKFLEIFHQTFSPMAQIACNMGFEQWQYHE